MCYLGHDMKLIELIRDWDVLDDDGTIYASQPREENSEAIVAHQPELGGLPPQAERPGLNYFLEVFIASKFVGGWAANLDAQPALQQECARLIGYAANDAQKATRPGPPLTASGKARFNRQVLNWNLREPVQPITYDAADHVLGFANEVARACAISSIC